MKFFHVYDERANEGLYKNGLLNKNSGFKIQHDFPIPDDVKFNEAAKKDGKFYNMIKETGMPFYVDRIAGGTTYHEYDFDFALIDEYRKLLGDWFLGFQLHESGSNRRQAEWAKLFRVFGHGGPYDPKEVREKLMSKMAKLPDGTPLPGFSQGTPEEYAKMTYAETWQEYVVEMIELFNKNLRLTNNAIIPCDSYYLATKLQADLGMKTFMPEVGDQIPLMGISLATARGAAAKKGKSWGAYYETWREVPGVGYTMPCLNPSPINDWYLTQDLFGDDFTTHGENGGSSRLLQKRIFYFAYMSGADYMSEEWGLKCCYLDFEDYALSAYGRVKKEFINTTLELGNMTAVAPFAIVLPKNYSCIEIPQVFEEYKIGVHRDRYMNSPLSADEKAYFGHIEDVLKLFYVRDEAGISGNEGHVITNGAFGNVFDIIYEDEKDDVLKQYAFLIDATKEGTFAKAKKGCGLAILESTDLDKLGAIVTELIKQVMPCYVDSLCWVVSLNDKGKRFVSIFNNEGNERSLEHGDTVDKNCDKRVTITLKDSDKLSIVKEELGNCNVEKMGEKTYCATIPAAGFVILEF